MRTIDLILNGERMACAGSDGVVHRMAYIPGRYHGTIEPLCGDARGIAKAHDATGKPVDCMTCLVVEAERRR